VNPPIAVRNRPGSPPRTVPFRLVAAVGAAVAVILAVAAWLAPTPSFVERVQLVNPSPYDLLVEVRAGDAGWLLVGVAAHDTTTAVEQVLDRGEDWTFRFSGQGRPAGTLTVERDALEDGDWRLEIPATAGETLAGAGAPRNP
jgi:hypothetical protein